MYLLCCQWWLLLFLSFIRNLWVFQLSEASVAFPPFFFFVFFLREMELLLLLWVFPPQTKDGDDDPLEWYWCTLFVVVAV